MNIAKIMIPKISTVFLYEKDTIRQGLERFMVHGYTAVPVLNDQELLYSGFEKIKAAVSFALKSNNALTLADHGGFRRESLWYENAIDII